MTTRVDSLFAMEFGFSSRCLLIDAYVSYNASCCKLSRISAPVCAGSRTKKGKQILHTQVCVQVTGLRHQSVCSTTVISCRSSRRSTGRRATPRAALVAFGCSASLLLNLLPFSLHDGESRAQRCTWTRCRPSINVKGALPR